MLEVFPWYSKAFTLQPLAICQGYLVPSKWLYLLQKYMHARTVTGVYLLDLEWLLKINPVNSHADKKIIIIISSLKSSVHSG